IPGEVHQGWPEPMPTWIYEDEVTLIEAARLLRRYHDLLATFTPPPDARWRIVAPGPHEVICHNDWAPYNALFDGHRPIAMLDWDSAGPGSRVWDVALPRTEASSPPKCSRCSSHSCASSPTSFRPRPMQAIPDSRSSQPGMCHREPASARRSSAIRPASCLPRSTRRLPPASAFPGGPADGRRDGTVGMRAGR